MRVIARKALREFWEKHADTEKPLRAWFKEAEKADWAAPAQIKERYRSASFVGNDRVVFNIAGNKYRLVVLIRYKTKTVYVRFLGAHEDYDTIDARTV